MGPGAAILPPEVSQIHMDFAMRTHNGHMGAKYVAFGHGPLRAGARLLTLPVPPGNSGAKSSRVSSTTTRPSP